MNRKRGDIMKRVDFSNGPHPICAGSCGGAGACGARVTFNEEYPNIPVFLIDSANVILGLINNPNRGR